LALGRGLSSRGHEVLSARDPGFEHLLDDEMLAVCLERNAVVMSHNERRFPRTPDPERREHPGVLLIPQCSQEDVPRVVEAIHRLATTNPEVKGKLLRFGLRSGWVEEPAGL
jgi:hypothetical protein